MSQIQLLQSAIRATAPIVAIPVEGSAPVCINGKRLRAWAKGIAILSVKMAEDCEWLGDVPDRARETRPTIQGRAIRVTGTHKGARCAATFAAIDRKLVIAELKIWAPKERERQQKKRLVGGLSADTKRAMRRAKYDDDADGMVEVMCATPEKCATCVHGRVSENCKSQGHEIRPAVPNPKKPKMGTPIELGAMQPLKFVIVRWGTVEADDVRFSITETITGMAVGWGNTAELAIVGARKNIAKQAPEKVQAMVDKILFEQAILQAGKLMAGAA